MNMTATADTHDDWTRACIRLAFVSFLVIVGYVLLPLVGAAIPYAGGAAVILGLGAVLCQGARSRGGRLAVATGLAGLLTLRVLSALVPGLLVARHGALSVLDGLALTALVLGCAALFHGASRTAAGPGQPSEPAAA